MFNPIVSELIAREQTKDRLRQAEQRRLAQAVARQGADHVDLRATFGNLVLAVQHTFKALVRRLGAI